MSLINENLETIFVDGGIWDQKAFIDLWYDTSVEEWRTNLNQTDAAACAESTSVPIAILHV